MNVLPFALILQSSLKPANHSQRFFSLFKCGPTVIWVTSRFDLGSPQECER